MNALEKVSKFFPLVYITNNKEIMGYIGRYFFRPPTLTNNNMEIYY